MDQWFIHERKVAGVVFLNLTAAFNVTDPNILIAKLRHYGFLLWWRAASLVEVFFFFSENKKKFFLLSGYLLFLESKKISCDVPKVSVVINDLAYAEVVKYDDHSTTFCDLGCRLGLWSNYFKSNEITISLHTFEVIVVVLGLQPLFFAVLRQKWSNERQTTRCLWWNCISWILAWTYNTWNDFWPASFIVGFFDVVEKVVS